MCVYIYLFQLTTEGVCVQIQMERWFPVANMTIQHLVNVFEYSETGIALPHTLLYLCFI